MPELPEVETIRVVLSKEIINHQIVRLDVHPVRIFRYQSISLLKKKIIGCTIQSVNRRAKYLLIKVDTGILLIHLGMSGQVLLAHANRLTGFVPDKHTHLTLILSNGITVYYRDPRMFGRVQFFNYQEDLEKMFLGFGPEPLTNDFNELYLAKLLIHKKANIKTLLLNQKIAPGMGNIYTDEALFKARIHPLQLGCSLEKKQIAKLVDSVKYVLQAGIKAKGASIADFCDPYQEQGRFQMMLQVYGRDGEKCLSCQSIIMKDVIAQRGTHWCPNCQKIKK